MSNGKKLKNKEILLELRDLSKIYPDVRAVDHIMLDVYDGEFITILGPSGSGKTTTLMMIAGFLYPTSGDVILSGRSLTEVPPHRRNFGMVFQDYALFPHMTAFHNVAFPLKMRKEPKDEIKRRVMDALAKVRLSGYEDHFPNELSGGQQQRVALARAIVFNPELLLFDEPLGSLDKKLREDLQIEVKHLQEDLGITAMHVTHDQEEALTMSDRICVLHEGKIEQVGRPEELYEKPASYFVADFIGKSNFLEVGVDHVEEERCVLDVAARNQKEKLFAPVTNPSANLKKEVEVMAVRPEKISLLNKEQENTHSAGENRLSGKVKEKIYIGNVITYVVEIGDDQFMEVEVQTKYGSGEFQEGDSVTLRWDISDSTLLSRNVR